MVKEVAPATLMVLDLLVQFVKPPSCSWPLWPVREIWEIIVLEILVLVLELEKYPRGVGGFGDVP